MMPASEQASCKQRARIDAHFAGRIGLETERSMRAHLSGCDSCHAYYERLMLLAELRPRGLSAQQRLGQALGVRRRTAPTWIAPLAVAAAAAAIAAFVLLPSNATKMAQPPAPFGFAARGAVESKLWVYRVAGQTKPSVATTWIAPNDELAFAYDNAANKKYLLVFGVNEKRGIYWYHPGWKDGSKNPRAISIHRAGKQHELSEAIHHQLKGSTLQIFGVFTDRPLTVRQVEDRIRQARSLDALSFSEAVTQRTILEIRRLGGQR